MKEKTKLIKNKAGVSAVIGVILMVAITVAIACTVYVYIAGMDFESDEDIIKSKIEVSQNYTIMDITFKDIWHVRHIDRVEIIIMDFDNASIVTIKGFLYNTNTNQLSYDNNSNLIKLKET